MCCAPDLHLQSIGQVAHPAPVVITVRQDDHLCIAVSLQTPGGCRGVSKQQQWHLMASKDQTLRKLVYVVLHPAGVGVQEIADHKNVVSGITGMCIAITGTVTPHQDWIMTGFQA